MQTVIKQQLFNKLAEVQDLLKQATCDSESYAQSLQDNIGWAAELDIALRTLTDNVDYYVD
jgi:hypothetical protein